MKIGYYDAKRVIYGLAGTIYYIEQTKEEWYYEKKFEGLTEHDRREIAFWLKLPLRTKEAELYLAMLEASAKYLHVPKYRIYTVEELFDLVKEKYEKTKYTFKVKGIYKYSGGICVFMPQEQLNDTFDLGNDYFSGYFSNSKIKDIDEKYIGSVLDLEALTKISRQLDVSMGNMMSLVNAFAIGIYMVVIYLLSKIIIEKNAQAISMTKILGYTNGEISRLYIWPTTIVVIICLLLSLPIEKAVMNVLFREMMLTSISGWIALWIDPKIYVEMFLIGIGTYAVVAMLEYRRIKHVPMDEALKNVE